MPAYHHSPPTPKPQSLVTQIFQNIHLLSKSQTLIKAKHLKVSKILRSLINLNQNSLKSLKKKYGLYSLLQLAR